MESDEIAVRTEKVRFSILHGFTKKLIREMDPREFNVNTGGWGYNFFIGHKVLFNLEDNWVPNDTLSIACKVERWILLTSDILFKSFFMQIQFSSDESTREALPIESEIGLIYAEKDSFVAGQLSDMALLVDSRIINVQKQILAGSYQLSYYTKNFYKLFSILF